jgi:hypothetical protein
MKRDPLLKISLIANGEVFAVCSDVELDPYSLSTARKFTFRKLTVLNEIEVGYRIRITVRICNARRDNLDDNVLHDFEVILLDFAENMGAEWWIYGLINNVYEDVYKQGVIDVFRAWQDNELYEWHKLPVGSPLKTDYLMACFYYSSIQSTITNKDQMCVDVSLVKDEQDFLYLLSKEFFGDRGYIGWNLYTFEDCLLELYNNSKDILKDREIVFYNTQTLFSPTVVEIFEEIKQIVLKYGFVISEEYKRLSR